MKDTTHMLAYLLLAFAVLSWSAFGWFAFAVLGTMDERLAVRTSYEEEALRQASALRRHAIARETKSERAVLAEHTGVDIVRMIETIEQVGTDSGTAIEIGQVSSAPSTDPAQPLNTVGFVIQSQGTFAHALRAAEMLYALSLPSTIESVQLERLPAAEAKGAWRLVVRMRVFTSAELPTS
ncbi:MAG: hypothetical protein HYS26_00310 [Candidatus Kaiserbacteria bacterium]|nr:MAG: hypothetical protein HYS26_00310 [Candidatus Kaiserbacteria bacterium]